MPGPGVTLSFSKFSGWGSYGSLSSDCHRDATAIVSSGKGFSLSISRKDMSVFRENETEVIRGKLDGQDYVVQEEKELAKQITSQHWHEALGHPSSDYIKS